MKIAVSTVLYCSEAWRTSWNTRAKNYMAKKLHQIEQAGKRPNLKILMSTRE